MTRSPLERLRDARHFAREAAQIVLGMDSDIFDHNRHYHHALHYCLLAIGEALRHVPGEIQAAAPDIPWRPIINMRYRLAHDYWLTDSRLVLEVGLAHVGSLIVALDRLIVAIEREVP